MISTEENSVVVITTCDITFDSGPQGEQGPQGAQGEQGPAGENGKDGVGIKEVKKTDNDGYMDIYTIFLTDDSSYEFKVPNPVVSLDVESYRIEFDAEYNIIDLPYYLGTSIPMDLLVYAQYADGSEMRVTDDKYAVTGFSTAEVGVREATVKFGPALGTVEYEVIDISDEIAVALADVGATDVVPGFAAGVYDYSYYSMGNQLAVTLDEDVDEGETVAAYQAILEAAGYTNAGADNYGDLHFVSENEQLDVCAWKGSDIGKAGMIYVDIKVLKGYFPIAAVNQFMSLVGYTFTFGEDIRDAFGINAWVNIAIFLW